MDALFGKRKPMFMIKFIPPQLTYLLRSKILRNGLPKNECAFPTDVVDGAFHLGLYLQEEIITIASFLPKSYKEDKEPGYQIRGMATDTPFIGKGYGKQLVEFAVEYLKKTNAEYLWCNARTTATNFYLKLGFEIISEEFEIPGIGKHYQMILKLK